MIITLAVWEASVRLFKVPELVLPAPSVVFRHIWNKRDLYIAFSQPTLIEILAGFAVAAVAGIGLGILVSFSDLAKRTAYPLLVSSQMVPRWRSRRCSSSGSAPACRPRC